MTPEKNGKCNCPNDCPAHSGIVANLENVETFIEKIMTNHLPHIQAALDSNKNWLIGVLGGLVVSLILLVANLIIMLAK